jgi:hypothetical protein
VAHSTPVRKREETISSEIQTNAYAFLIRRDRINIVPTADEHPDKTFAFGAASSIQYSGPASVKYATRSCVRVLDKPHMPNILGHVAEPAIKIEDDI